MAKQKKEQEEKPIEVTLWDAANKLRGQCGIIGIQTRGVEFNFFKILKKIICF